VAAGHLEIMKVLLAKGARPDGVEKSGRPPLHVACARGDLEAVRLLIAGGANVNARWTYVDRGWRVLPPTNQTPLHLAAAFAHLEVVRLLLESGADADAKDSEGRTPLDCAKGPPRHIGPPGAKQGKDRPAIVELLSRKWRPA